MAIKREDSTGPSKLVSIFSLFLLYMNLFNMYRKIKKIVEFFHLTDLYFHSLSISLVYQSYVH